jgi:[acyl-carrier-protein] S-malonyltransferase
MKIAWLFPGQGSQAVGMGRSLHDALPAARSVLERADAALGFPLTELLFQGPAEALERTVNTQPAIVAVSLAALAAFCEQWRATYGAAVPDPAFVAGHSVGEYAALAAAGAAGEQVALQLVRARAEAMQAAAEAQPGGMVAILGLGLEAVQEACRRARAQVAGSYVDVANHNAATQVAIAGDPAGLDLASRLCREAGARRCIPLKVGGAFHSAAMASATDPLARAIAAADVQDARVPLVANVTAMPLRAASELRAELRDQITAPVRWSATIDFLLRSGVTQFVEFGAGQILTNLIQRLDRPVEAMAVGDAAAVHAGVAWMVGGEQPAGRRSEK